MDIKKIIAAVAAAAIAFGLGWAGNHFGVDLKGEVCKPGPVAPVAAPVAQ